MLFTLILFTLTLPFLRISNTDFFLYSRLFHTFQPSNDYVLTSNTPLHSQTFTCIWYCRKYNVYPILLHAVTFVFPHFKYRSNRIRSRCLLQSVFGKQLKGSHAHLELRPPATPQFLFKYGLNYICFFIFIISY